MGPFLYVLFLSHFHSIGALFVDVLFNASRTSAPSRFAITADYCTSTQTLPSSWNPAVALRAPASAVNWIRGSAASCPYVTVQLRVTGPGGIGNISVWVNGQVFTFAQLTPSPDGNTNFIYSFTTFDIGNVPSKPVLPAAATARAITVPMTLEMYHVDVGFGSQNQMINVLLDAGSSGSYVPTINCTSPSCRLDAVTLFDYSASTTPTAFNWTQSPDSSSWYVADVLSLGSGTSQVAGPYSFAARYNMTGNGRPNGLLGVAQGSINGRAVVDHDSLPEVWYRQGRIPKSMIGFYADPRVTNSSDPEGLYNSAVTFGDINTTFINETAINWIPSQPRSSLWLPILDTINGIDAGNSPMIIDTGGPGYGYLRQDLAAPVFTAIGGRLTNPSNNRTWVVPRNSRLAFTFKNGTRNDVYYVAAADPTSCSSGMCSPSFGYSGSANLIRCGAGYEFFRQFYLAYDYTTSRVGLGNYTVSLAAGPGGSNIDGTGTTSGPSMGTTTTTAAPTASTSVSSSSDRSDPCSVPELFTMLAVFCLASMRWMT